MDKNIDEGCGRTWKVVLKNRWGGDGRLIPKTGGSWNKTPATPLVDKTMEHSTDNNVQQNQLCLYLDIFVMMLLERLQVLGDIGHDGCPTRDVVYSPVTVGMKEEALPALVEGGGHRHLKFSQLLPRVGACDQGVIKEEVFIVRFVWKGQTPLASHLFTDLNIINGRK